MTSVGRKLGSPGTQNKRLPEKSTLKKKDLLSPRLAMGSRDHLFKVLVVGDAAVGKTSLVQRYSQDSFSKHYKSTVGGERPRAAGGRRRGLQPVVAGYWGRL